MASKHLVTSLFLRATEIPVAAQRRLFIQPIAPAIRRQRASLQGGQQRRFESDRAGPGSSNKIYSFEQIQDLVSKPSADRILIDTREAGELQSTGKIPGALHVPVQSSPDAYFLSPDDFEDRFGFAKPALNKEVVFYCKAGVRSRAAAQLARQAGYVKTGEYAGSWLDWDKRGGEKEKV